MAKKGSIKIPNIFPLSKNSLKGAFCVDDPKFKHLINFYITAAWNSQQEKKSKIYIVVDKDRVLAYMSVSVGLFEEIQGEKNTTSHEIQALLIGKLYVLPEYRGRGIGTDLLRFATDMTCRLDEMTGCSGLIVDSNSDADTLKFYSRFGFKEIDQIENEKKERTITMFFKLPV